MFSISLVVWIGVLLMSLFALVKGAEIFLGGAKQLGRSLGMSSFAVGVLIVGFGTSLPELASSVAAVFEHVTTLVPANVVGSNITNILLIIGVMAVTAGRLVFAQDILKTELPLFVISQALLVGVIVDGVVERLEAVFLLLTFLAYLWYIVIESKKGDENVEIRPPFKLINGLMIIFGLLAVLVGAHYTVAMTVNIATVLSIPVSLISITALAIGTSLPELIVGIQSARKGEMEMALGNIFGSNTFNALVVLGIPALITNLTVDNVVLGLGIWVMLAASVMIFVIGLSRQVMRWEGLMMLIFFAFFLTKLTAFL